MPDIAITANPIAVATPGAVPVAGADAGTFGQTVGAFAALLQQQMANPAVPAGMAGDLAASFLGDGTESAQAGAADAMLPLLLDGAAFAAIQAEMGKSMKPPLEEGRGAGRENPGADETPVVVALPVTAATEPARMQAAPAAATPANGTVTPTAVATANLAAAADLAGGAAARTAPVDGAELLPNVGREVAAAAPASVHSQSPVVTHVNTQAVATPVGADGWNTEIGNRLVWMAGQQSSRAELVLTPPQMGRIEVSLTVTGDQATAQFVSANPAVREAIENAVPRLREILAEAGITLGQTQVGAETPGQSAHGDESRDNVPRNDAVPGTTLPANAGSVAWSATGRGLVDVFA